MPMSSAGIGLVQVVVQGWPASSTPSASCPETNSSAERGGRTRPREPIGHVAGTAPQQRFLGTVFYQVGVELRGLEPLTPCLQRSLARCSDLCLCS